MEEIQFWMGLAFHPSMSEYLKKTRYRSVLVEYKIPVKKEYEKVEIPKITIGWVDRSNARDIEIFKEWITDNKRQEEIKNNTLDFYNFCKERDSRLTSIGVDLEPI